jgi:putative endonuclease
MSYYVYILKSQKNGSYYVGSSDNPKKRLLGHNLGRSIYTKRNLPYKLVFTQEVESLSKARLVETEIKKWKRKDFIEKIIRDGKIKSQG